MNKPEVRMPESQDKQIKKISKEELAKQIRKRQERDAEKVTGIFKNLENPASGGSRGSVVFTYKAYPGEEVVTYELYDGERYSIPRGVAHHLNNNCFVREYQHLPGEFGDQGVRTAAGDGRLRSNTMQMSRKKHRFAFHSLEYMDDDPEMNAADIIEVTHSI